MEISRNTVWFCLLFRWLSCFRCTVGDKIIFFRERWCCRKSFWYFEESRRWSQIIAPGLIFLPALSTALGFSTVSTLFLFVRNRIPWLEFDVLNFSVLWASNYFNVFSSFWKIVSKPIVLYAAVNWLSYALFIHFLAKNVYSNRSKCFLIAFIVSEITFSVFQGCCEMLDCYFQTEFVLRLFLNMRAFWGSVFLWHCSYKKSLYNH